MEIVRLETIHHRRAFADRAVLELEDGDAGGGVFVGRENFARGPRIVAGDFAHVAAQAEEQGIERVAAGCEQRAPTGVLARVPAKLSVPRPDAVVIVHLCVMEFAEQPLVDGGSGGEELARVTALETDAGFDPGLSDGRFHSLAFLP